VASFNFVTPCVGSSDGNRTVIPGVDPSNPFPNGFQPVTSPWGRYHGLQTRWEKRLSHGLQFIANYTYSKSLYYDPQSVVKDRFYKYVTDTDRTHIARLFFTADPPFGRQRAYGDCNGDRICVDIQPNKAYLRHWRPTPFVCGSAPLDSPLRSVTRVTANRRLVAP
jgi:hypothetical protein